MITIQISNGQGQVIGIINDFFALHLQDEINKGGSLKLVFPLTDWIRTTPLKKGYRISVNYGISIKKNLMLFDGYISDFVLKSESIEIEAYNWLHYLQYRLIKQKKTYNSTAIKTIVTEIFEQINQSGQLPFLLGKNDSESLVNLEIEEGTSFFDLLRQINEQKSDCLFRIVQKQGISFLEVGEEIGEVLQGVRECDTSDPGKTNIVNREWKDSMDEFWNAQGQLKNEEHIKQTGLLFERPAEEDKNTLPKAIPLPAITISRDTDWRDFNVGDRKAIRLITGYEWLLLSYTGLIQERKISIGAGGLKSEIKVSQEYRENVNVLDTLIKNLKKKKGGTSVSTAPVPSVDLSGYASSTAVAQALQAQNTKLAQKADSAFVAGVAQTAQTALNTANQAQQTANSKADAQHNHDDRYYTETEIDEKLREKADGNHTHNFPTSLPASDVYDWAKAPAKPSYGIDEISGLREALSNSSSSVASMDRILFAYTTDLTSRNFRIASRHQLSNISHGSQGHILQLLWGDLVPEGNGHDGGRGFEFGPHGNPYLKMISNNTYIGRTDGHIFPQNWIELPNHKGLHWSYNSDFAQIYFRSNNNDDTSLDFKLGDDGTERFRFLFNGNWRAAWNHNVATFKQKFFAHAQYGEFSSISLAIGDSDTGFNRESDGVFSMYSNGQKIQTFHQNAVPIVAEDLGHNVKIRKLTQAQYDALGAGRPSNVIYYIID